MLIDLLESEQGIGVLPTSPAAAMNHSADQLNYCHGCGGQLVAEGSEHPVCSTCGRIHYLDPKVAAAAIVPMEGGIVLVRRAIEPAYGMWSFPSGYVNRGEKVESAVEREVMEECGLDVTAAWLVRLYSEPGARVILGVYHAEINGGELIAGSETLESGSFTIDSLPDLAFERDDRIIRDWEAGKRLRGL